MCNLRRRVYSADALRGLAIIVVVIYHLIYSLDMYHLITPDVLQNPVMNGVQLVSSSIFILLCGFSCRYSRSNLRRGLKMLAFAVAITCVTAFVKGSLIVFGMLHFLAVSVVIYSFIEKLLDRIHGKLQMPLYILLFIAAYAAYLYLKTPEVRAVLPPHLWVFGLADSTFWSADYVPLMPWFFMFLIGTRIGKSAVDNRLPEWAYSLRCPPLEAIGRNTLWIYLAHQPIIMACIWIFTQ